MACNEVVCRNSKCNFQEFNNTAIKICPLCGDKALNFFDECIDLESLSGDDYDIALEDGE